MTAATIAAVVLGEYEDGQTVTLSGRAGNIQFHTTKQNNPWATFLLIDNDTGVRVAVLPYHYQEYAPDLIPERVDGRAVLPQVTVIGRVDNRETPATIIADLVRREGP